MSSSHIPKIVILTLLLHSVLTFKFPDAQQEDSRNAQPAPSYPESEGRFLNIRNAPNSLFNRLTATNNLQDDIGDYDENVGNQQSAVTAPSTTNQYQDAQDRRRHRDRKRPCVPYSYRNRDNQGRFFLSLSYNDYNYYDGQQGAKPIYDPVGGYPCVPQRPHRPHRPLYPGTSPLSDDPGTGNRPGLGFFGPGGLFDINMILTNWLRPGGAYTSPGGGALASDPATGTGTGTTNVQPLLELNVQDAVQNVV